MPSTARSKKIDLTTRTIRRGHFLFKSGKWIQGSIGERRFRDESWSFKNIIDFLVTSTSRKGSYIALRWWMLWISYQQLFRYCCKTTRRIPDFLSRWDRIVLQINGQLFGCWWCALSAFTHLHSNVKQCRTLLIGWKTWNPLTDSAQHLIRVLTQHACSL